MRSRAPLMLMELTLMLLVLALVAGLCLQAFLWADRSAGEMVSKDAAMVHLQNVAQVLRHCGGDYAAAARVLDGSWDGHTWHVDYGNIRVLVRPEEMDTAFLGGAVLEALCGEAVIADLHISWQEVDHGD